MAGYDFQGRAAIVTGAGSGIRLACAHAVAAGGAAVLVADIDTTRAEMVAGQIVEAGQCLHGRRDRS